MGTRIFLRSAEMIRHHVIYLVRHGASAVEYTIIENLSYTSVQCPLTVITES